MFDLGHVKNVLNFLSGKKSDNIEKSIIYTILSIASEACNIVKKIEKKEKYPSNLKREMKVYTILHN